MKKISVSDETEGFISKFELQRRIPVAPRTLTTWIKRGFIPHCRLPGSRRLLFDWRAVEAALKRHEQGGVN